MKAAVLDLGTNTFHLLIAQFQSDGSWQKLLKKQVAVKLGKGGIHERKILKTSYDKGMRTLEVFHSLLREYRVKEVRVIGTAALRRASNGIKFISEAHRRFGFEIEVISGEQEAELIYLGAKQAVRMDSGVSLIMDIGGGSVEFIISNNSKMLWKGSYELGAALLLGQFAPGDPMTKQDVKTINSYLDKKLKSLWVANSRFHPSRIIGTAGSFETIASMIRHRVPGSGSHYGKTEHPIAWKDFMSLHAVLLKSDKQKRMRMKGLIKMRVDMIVMASLLLSFVLECTGIRNMTLSAYSLKEGALWQMLQSSVSSRQ